MSEIKLKIMDEAGVVKQESPAGADVALWYEAEYVPGDGICIESDTSGIFLDVRLEDTMLPALVYLAGNASRFQIPFGEGRNSYSPKSFTGGKHLVTARLAAEEEVYARRNLALNPFDQHGTPGLYPHVSANVETRGEANFAARNAIDGIYANWNHGHYPFESWGINQRADAEIKLEFGLPVALDELRLTLRADFPHDSWWTQATAVFSDGSEETISLEKTAAPQSYRFATKTVEWLVLKELKKAEDESPFPALSALEALGTVKA